MAEPDNTANLTAEERIQVLDDAAAIARRLAGKKASYREAVLRHVRWLLGLEEGG